LISVYRAAISRNISPPTQVEEPG